MKYTKPNNYYNNFRSDIMPLVPTTSKCILDVGCGTGALGVSLKHQNKVKVVGIEIDKYAANQAVKKLDYVIQGDVEIINLPFEHKTFDCIIYADILEHLRDPWKIMDKHKQYLKCGGTIILSIPNIQHIYTFYNLLRGRWDYKDRGIFDRTHLRFFTRKSIQKMLNNNGYEIIKIKRNYRFIESSDVFNQILKFIPFDIIRDFFTFQYLIEAKNICDK